jgi:hypothetical protein
LGGWTMSGVIQLQSGVPFSVFHSGQDPNADGYVTDRAVFTGTNLSGVYTGDDSAADGFFDPDQFVGMNTRVAQLGPAAACGPGNGQVVSATRWWCNGTLGRNVLTGPAFQNVDLGIHKRFKITEGTSIQLQANAFNLFNHPNFGLPVSNLNSSQVGRSIATAGTPRVMQLALRFDF